MLLIKGTDQLWERQVRGDCRRDGRGDLVDPRLQPAPSLKRFCGGGEEEGCEGRLGDQPHQAAVAHHRDTPVGRGVEELDSDSNTGIDRKKIRPAHDVADTGGSVGKGRHGVLE